VSEAKPPKRYGFSATAAAGARFGRALGVFFLVIVVNTALQTGLAQIKQVPLLTDPGFLLIALVSLLALVLSLNLIATAALAVPYGHVTVRQALATALPRLPRFVLWGTVWVVVVMAGMMIYLIPGLLIIAITPYYTLALADGSPHPLKSNFQAIRSRPGRYVAMILMTTLILVLCYLFGSAANLLIAGVSPTLVVTFLMGLVVTWLVLAWALIYRSTPPGTFVERKQAIT
jgi:hypothetical protein